MYEKPKKKKKELGWRLTRQGTREPDGVMGLFCIFIGVVITEVYTFI